jgi:hypothetical protein
MRFVKNLHLSPDKTAGHGVGTYKYRPDKSEGAWSLAAALKNGFFAVLLAAVFILVFSGIVMSDALLNEEGRSAVDKLTDSVEDIIGLDGGDGAQDNSSNVAEAATTRTWNGTTTMNLSTWTMNSNILVTGLQSFAGYSWSSGTSVGERGDYTGTDTSATWDHYWLIASAQKSGYFIGYIPLSGKLLNFVSSGLARVSISCSASAENGGSIYYGVQGVNTLYSGSFTPIAYTGSDASGQLNNINQRSNVALASDTKCLRINLYLYDPSHAFHGTWSNINIQFSTADTTAPTNLGYSFMDTTWAAAAWSSTSRIIKVTAQDAGCLRSIALEYSTDGSTVVNTDQVIDWGVTSAAGSYVTTLYTYDTGKTVTISAQNRYFRVRATDISGNTAATAWYDIKQKLKIDDVTPQVGALALKNGAGFSLNYTQNTWSSTDVRVSVTSGPSASNNVSGLTWQYSAGGGAWTNYDSVAAISSDSGTNTTYGIVKNIDFGNGTAQGYRFRLVSGAGLITYVGTVASPNNPSTASTHTIKIDTKSPVFTANLRYNNYLTGPAWAGSGNWNKQNVYASITYQGNGDGIINISGAEFAYYPAGQQGSASWAPLGSAGETQTLTIFTHGTDGNYVFAVRTGAGKIVEVTNNIKVDTSVPATPSSAQLDEMANKWRTTPGNWTLPVSWTSTDTFDTTYNSVVAVRFKVWDLSGLSSFTIDSTSSNTQEGLKLYSSFASAPNLNIPFSGGDLTSGTGARRIDIWVTDQAGNTSAVYKRLVYWDTNDYSISLLTEGANAAQGTIRIVERNGATVDLGGGTFKRGEVLKIRAATSSPSVYLLNQVLLTMDGDANRYSIYGGALNADANYWNTSSPANRNYFTAKKVYESGSAVNYWGTESYTMSVGPIDVNADTSGINFASFASVRASFREFVELDYERSERKYNGREQGSYFNYTPRTVGSPANWTAAIVSIFDVSYKHGGVPYGTSPVLKYGNGATLSTWLTAVQPGMKEVGNYSYSAQIYSCNYVSNAISDMPFEITQRKITLTPLSYAATGQNYKVYGDPHTWLWNGSTFVAVDSTTRYYADPEIKYVYTIEGYTFTPDSAIVYNGAPIVQGGAAIESTATTGDKYLRDDSGNFITQLAGTGLTRTGAGMGAGSSHNVGNSYEILIGNLVFGAAGNNNFNMDLKKEYFTIVKRPIALSVTVPANEMMKRYDPSLAGQSEYIIASTGPAGQDGSGANDIFDVSSGNLAYGDKLVLSLIAVSGTTGTNNWNAGIYRVGISFSADAVNDNYTVTNYQPDTTSSFNINVPVLPEAYFIIYPGDIFIRPVTNQGKQFGEENPLAVDYNVYTSSTLTPASINNTLKGGIFPGARFVRQPGEDVGIYYYTNALGYHYNVGAMSNNLYGQSSLLVDNAAEVYTYDFNGLLTVYTLGMTQSGGLYSPYEELEVGLDYEGKKTKGQFLWEAVDYLESLGYDFSSGIDAPRAFLYVWNGSSLVPYSSIYYNDVVTTGRVFLYCPDYKIGSFTTGSSPCLYNGSNGAALQSAGYVYNIAVRDANATNDYQTVISPVPDQSKIYGNADAELNWGLVVSGVLGGKSLTITPFAQYSTAASTDTRYFGIAFATGSALVRALRLPEASPVFSITYTPQGGGAPVSRSYSSFDFVTFRMAELFRDVNGDNRLITMFEQAGDYYIVPSIDYGETINWGGFVYGYYSTVNDTTGLTKAGMANHASFKLSFYNSLTEGSPDGMVVYKINKRVINMSVTAGQTYIYGEVNFAGSTIIAHTISNFASNPSIGISDITYTPITIGDPRVEAWYFYLTPTESLEPAVRALHPNDFLNNVMLAAHFPSGFVGLYKKTGAAYAPWYGNFADIGDGLYLGSVSPSALSSKLALAGSLSAGIGYAVSTSSYTVSGNYSLIYDTATTMVIHPRKVYANFFDKTDYGTGYTAQQLLTSHMSAANRLTKVYDRTDRVYQAESYIVTLDWFNVLGNASAGLAPSERASMEADPLFISASYANYIALGGQINNVTGFERQLADYVGFNATFRYKSAGINTGNYVLVLPDMITVDITPRPISVDITEMGSPDWLVMLNTKYYDGTTEAINQVLTPGGISSTGICAGDTINITLVSAKFAQANVAGAGAVPDAVTVTLIFSISGAGAYNYTVNNHVTSAVINRKVVTVDVGDITVQYGDTPIYTASYSGWVGGDSAALIAAVRTFTTSSRAAVEHDYDYSQYYTYLLEGGASAYPGLTDCFKAGTTHDIEFGIGGADYFGNYQFVADTGTLTIAKKTVTFSLTNSSIPVVTFAAFADYQQAVNALEVSAVPFPDSSNPSRTFGSVTITMAVSFIEQDGVTPTTFEAIRAAAAMGIGDMYNVLFVVDESDFFFAGEAMLFFSVGVYQEITIEIVRDTAVYNGDVVDFTKLLSFTYNDGSGTVTLPAEWAWVFGGTFSGSSSGSFIDGNGPRNAGNYSVIMTVSYKGPEVSGYGVSGFYGNLPAGLVTILKADVVVVPEAASKTYGTDDPDFNYSGFAFYPVADASALTGYEDIYIKYTDNKYHRVIEDGGLKIVIDNATAIGYSEAVHGPLFRLTALIRDGEDGSGTAQLLYSVTRDAGIHAGDYVMRKGAVSFGGTTFAYANHNILLASEAVDATAELSGTPLAFEIDGESASTIGGEVFFTINSKTVTVTVMPGTKIYDNTSNAVINYAASGYVTEYGDSAANLLDLKFLIRKRVNIDDATAAGYIAAGTPQVYGSAGDYYILTESTMAGKYYAVLDSGFANRYADPLYPNDYVLEIQGYADCFTITKRVVIVTVSTYNSFKYYGDPDPVFYYTYNSADIVDGATFSGALGRTYAGSLEGEDVGTYSFTLGSLRLTDNYVVGVSSSVSFTIRKVTLTVTQPDVTRQFYAANPETLSVSISGFKTIAYTSAGGITYPETQYRNDQQIITALLTGYTLKINYMYNGQQISRYADAGVYENAITAQYSQGGVALSLTNYTINYAPSRLTITPIPITMTAAAARFTKVYGTLDDANLFQLRSGMGNPVLIGSPIIGLNFSVVIGAANPADVPTLLNSVHIFGTFSRAAKEDVGSYLVSKGSVRCTRSDTDIAESPNFILTINPFYFTITKRPVNIYIDNENSILTKQYGDFTPVIRPTGRGNWAPTGAYTSVAYNGQVLIADNDEKCIVMSTGAYEYFDNINYIYNNRNAIPGYYPIHNTVPYTVSSNYQPTFTNLGVIGGTTVFFEITKKQLAISDANFYVYGKVYDGTDIVLDGDAGVVYTNFDLVGSDSVTITFQARYASSDAGITEAIFSYIGLDYTAADQSRYYDLIYYEGSGVQIINSASPGPLPRFYKSLDNFGNPIEIDRYPIGFDKSAIKLKPRQYDGTTTAEIVSVQDGIYTYYEIGIPRFVQKVVQDNASVTGYGMNFTVNYQSKNVNYSARATVYIRIDLPRAAVNFTVGTFHLDEGEYFTVSDNYIEVYLTNGITGVIQYRDLYLSVFAAINKVYDATPTAQFNYNLGNIICYLQPDGSYIYEQVGITFAGVFADIDEFGIATITSDVGFHTAILETLSNGRKFLLTGADKGNYSLVLKDYDYVIADNGELHGDDLYTWEYSSVYKTPTAEQIAALDEIYRKSGDDYIKITDNAGLYAIKTLATQAQILAGLNLYVLIDNIFVPYVPAQHGGRDIYYCVLHELYHRSIEYSWQPYVQANDYTDTLTPEMEADTDNLYVIYNGEYVQYIPGTPELIGYTPLYKHNKVTYSIVTEWQVTEGVNLYVATGESFMPGATENQLKARENVYIRYSVYYSVPTPQQLSANQNLFVYDSGEWIPYTTQPQSQARYRNENYYMNLGDYEPDPVQDGAIVMDGAEFAYFTRSDGMVRYDRAVHGAIYGDTTAIGGYKVYYASFPSVYYTVATDAELAAGEELYVIFTGYRDTTNEDMSRGLYLYNKEGDDYVPYVLGVLPVYYFERNLYVPYDAENPEHDGLAVYYRHCGVFTRTASELDYPVTARMKAEITPVTLEVTANIESKTYDATTNASLVPGSDLVTSFSNVVGQGYDAFRMDMDAATARFTSKDVAINSIGNVTTREVLLSDILLYKYINIRTEILSGAAYNTLLTDGASDYVGFKRYYRPIAEGETPIAGANFYVFKSEYYAEADGNTVSECLEKGTELYFYRGGAFVVRDKSEPIRGDKPVYYRLVNVFVPYDDTDFRQSPADSVYYCYYAGYAPYTYSAATSTYAVIMPDGTALAFNEAEFKAAFGNELYKLYRVVNKNYVPVTDYSYAAYSAETLYFKTSGQEINNYVYNKTANLSAYINPKKVSLNAANVYIKNKVYDKNDAGEMVFKAVSAQATEYYNALRAYFAGATNYAEFIAAAQNMSGFTPLYGLYVIDYENLDANGDFVTHPLYTLLKDFTASDYDDFMAIAPASALSGLGAMFGGIYTTSDTILSGIYAGDEVAASYRVVYNQTYAGDNINVRISINALSGANRTNYLTDETVNITVKGNILPIELDIVRASVADKVYNGTAETAVEDVIISGVLAGDICSAVASGNARLTYADGSDARDFAETGYYGMLVGLNLTGRDSRNYIFKLVPGFVWKDGQGRVCAFAVTAPGELDTSNSISARPLSVSVWADSKPYDGTTSILPGKYGFKLSNVTSFETAIPGTNAYSIDIDYEYYEVIAGSGIFAPKVYFAQPNVNPSGGVEVKMYFKAEVYNMRQVDGAELFDPDTLYYLLVFNAARNCYQYEPQRGLTEFAAGAVYYVRDGVNRNYVNSNLYVPAQGVITKLTVTATANDVSDNYGSFDVSRMTVSYTEPGVQYYNIGEAAFNSYTPAYAEALGFGNLLSGYSANLTTESFATPASRAAILGFKEATTECSNNNNAFADVIELPGGAIGGYVIYVKNAAAANYSFNYVPGTYRITKATLYISVADASRPFGVANPAFPIIYSGWLGTDNANLPSSYFVAPTVTSAAGPNSPIGSDYDITVSGGYARNYVMKWYSNGNYYDITNTPLAVAKLTIVRATFGGITFNSLTAVYDGTGKKLDITQGNALPAGTVVTYSDTIEGTLKTYSTPRMLVNAGTYTITARLDNPNYTSRTYTATLKIEKATPVITARTITTVYMGSAISGIADVYPYDLPVAYHYYTDKDNEGSLMAGAPANAGTYYYYASTAGNSNYNPERTSLVKLTILKVTVGVIVIKQTYVEGDPDGNGVEFALSNENLTDIVNASVKYTDKATGVALPTGNVPTAAGLYEFNIISGNPNYTLAGGKGILTIGAKQLETPEKEVTVTPVDSGTILDSQAYLSYHTIVSKNNKPAEDPDDRVIWAQAKSAVGGGYNLLAVISANLLIDEQGVSRTALPGGGIMVTLRIPDGIDTSKAMLMRYNEDGTVTEIDAVFERGYAVFMTDELGTFAIVEKATAFWVWIAVGGGAGFVLIGAFVFAFIANKKRQLEYGGELISKNKEILSDDDPE